MIIVLTGKKMLRMDNNIHRKILKASIIDIDDLIRFWNLNMTFRTILSVMDWTRDIWLDVISKGCSYIDFLPLAEVLVYLYERRDISLSLLETFVASRYSIENYETFGVPRVLLDRVKFKDSALYMFLSCFIQYGNYEIATFLLEKNRLLDLSSMYDNNFVVKIVHNRQMNFLRLIIRQKYSVNVSDADKLLDAYRNKRVYKRFLLSAIRIFIDSGIDLKELKISLILDHGDMLIELLSLLGDVLDPSKRFPCLLLDGKIVPVIQGNLFYTLLEIICINGYLSELIVLIGYGMDITDKRLSKFNLIGAVRASKSENKEEMMSVLVKRGYKKR
jgi:hypothetical protein